MGYKGDFYRNIFVSRNTLLPELYHQPKYHQSSIYSLSWFSNTLLASGSNDQSIKLLQCKDGVYTNVGVVSNLGGTIRELCFMPSVKLVSCGGGPRPLQLIDIHQGKIIQEFKSQQTPLLSMTRLDDHTIITGSEDAIVSVWDMRCPQTHTQHYSLSHSVTSLTLFRDNLSCAMTSGECITLSLTRGQVRTKWQPHKEECRSLRYSPCGHWLLSSSYDGTVCITDSSYKWSLLSHHDNKVIQSRWHSSGQVIATTSTNKTACFWKLLNI